MTRYHNSSFLSFLTHCETFFYIFLFFQPDSRLYSNDNNDDDDVVLFGHNMCEINRKKACRLVLNQDIISCERIYAYCKAAQQ